jgi:hypothetical protein
LADPFFGRRWDGGIDPDTTITASLAYQAKKFARSATNLQNLFAMQVIPVNQTIANALNVFAKRGRVKQRNFIARLEAHDVDIVPLVLDQAAVIAGGETDFAASRRLSCLRRLSQRADAARHLRHLEKDLGIWSPAPGTCH